MDIDNDGVEPEDPIYEVEIRALDDEGRAIDIDPDFVGSVTLDELPGLLRAVMAERAELVSTSRTAALTVGIFLPDPEDSE